MSTAVARGQPRCPLPRAGAGVGSCARSPSPGTGCPQCARLSCAEPTRVLPASPSPLGAAGTQIQHCPKLGDRAEQRNALDFARVKSGSSQECDAASTRPPTPPPAATRQPAGRSASSGLRKSNSDHPRDSSAGEAPPPQKASSYSGVCPPPASLSSCIPRWARTEQIFQKPGGRRPGGAFTGPQAPPRRAGSRPGPAPRTAAPG